MLPRTVMHLELKAAGQVIYLCDAVMEPVERGTAIHLVLEFPDGEGAQKAFDSLARGGQVTLPLARQFWGALHGMLVDRFGVRWQITTAT